MTLVDKTVIIKCVEELVNPIIDKIPDYDFAGKLDFVKFHSKAINIANKFLFEDEHIDDLLLIAINESIKKILLNDKAQCDKLEFELESVDFEGDRIDIDTKDLENKKRNILNNVRECINVYNLALKSMDDTMNYIVS
jgi:hypothetical protein